MKPSIKHTMRNFISFIGDLILIALLLAVLYRFISEDIQPTNMQILTILLLAIQYYGHEDKK